MQIRPLGPNESSTEKLVETYIIEDCTTFNELLKVYQLFKMEHQDKTVLVSLDDTNQAEYTSTHAIQMNNLDETEGYDLSKLDPSAFENGEHIGYLSTASEFFIRKVNFLKQIEDVDFSSACDRGLSIEETELLLLQKINNNPIAYIDQQIVLKIVPVNKSYEALCASPNGYFASDLNPFENYAIAKHLHDKYGYELFGIGASLLGFIRASYLDDQQAKELKDDLIKLYQADAGMSHKLLELVKSHHHLFIKYTESIS